MHVVARLERGRGLYLRESVRIPFISHRSEALSVRILVAAVTLSTAACAAATRGPGADRSADELLERAIQEAGGSAALSRARAVEWDGEATVRAGGRVVRLAGQWQVQPPDSAVVSTYEVSKGRGTTRSMVLAAPRGWLVSDRQFTPMSSALLASERAEFYLYQLFRLVPLLEPGVTRSAVEPDSSGQPGVRVEQRGRPIAFLYFNPRGRLAHVRMQVPSPDTGELQWQDAWLAGLVESGGVRWPRELHFQVNGQPYFDLTIDSFRVLSRLESALLSGPP